MLADTQSCRNFGYTVTPLRDLLGRFNLEFFRELRLLVHKHFYLLELRLSGV